MATQNYGPDPYLIGKTMYVTFRSDDQYWNGSAMEDYDAANWATYDAEDRRSLYVYDDSNPFVAGCTESGVGNDYVISGEVTYDAMTELGFLARGNTTALTGYVLSLDPTNSYFNLIKLTGGGNFVNIEDQLVTGLTVSTGDTFTIDFEVDGSAMTGHLYDSGGTLLATIHATDSDYATGVLGPWAWNKGNGIEGTFSELELDSTSFPRLSAFSLTPPDTFTQSAVSVDANGHVSWTIPSGLAAGRYDVCLYVQAGGSPVISDGPAYASGELNWNGTSQVGLESVELADSEDVYHADIFWNRDNSDSRDEYTVNWFKSGVSVTSGITNAQIQVTKRSDGTSAIDASDMTQIGSMGAYKYDSSVRLTDGAIATATATIDGETRTWRMLIGRDT